MARGLPFVSLDPRTPAEEVLRKVSAAAAQDVFPVVDRGGELIGLVNSDSMRVLTTESTELAWILAADVMQPAVFVHPEDDLRTAAQCMIANGLREIPVVDDRRIVLGFLDEREVAKVYLATEARAQGSASVQASPTRPRQRAGATERVADRDPPRGGSRCVSS
jgi:CIC family chloride channel protein